MPHCENTLEQILCGKLARTGKILIGRYKILVSLDANMAYGTYQSLSQSAGIFHNENLLEMVKIDIPISKGFIACGNETADFVRFVKRFSLCLHIVNIFDNKKRTHTF